MKVHMTMKKAIAATGAAALIGVAGIAAAGTVMAQSTTPPTATAPVPNAATGRLGMGPGFGFMGGSTAEYDAVAKALNLTPTQLFDQLHSGKTLDEIATAQGVDIQTVQDAAKAVRVQAMQDEIKQQVTDGKITQDQADWMLQGLEKGYLPMGPGGHRGGRGIGLQGQGLAPNQTPNQTPATATPGATS